MQESTNKTIDNKEKLESKIQQLEESLSEMKEIEEKALIDLEIAENVLKKLDVEFFVLNKKNKIIFISQNLCKRYSLLRKEILGKDFSDLEKISQFFIQHFEKSDLGIGILDKGKTLYLRNENRPTGMPAYHMQLFYVLPIALVYISVDGGIIEYNKSFKELLNFQEELNSKNIFELDRTKDSLIIKDLKKCLNTGELFIEKKAIIKNNGETKFIDYSIIPAVDPRKKVIGAIITIGDSSNKLVQQEELIRILTALDNTGVAIITTDRKSKLSYVNKSAVNLWGFENNGEMINRCELMDLFDNESLKKLTNHWDKMVSERVFFFADKLTAIKSDGNKIPVEVKATLINDTNEQPIGVTLSLYDISDQIESRNELVMAKEMAEESDRLKSAFLANMSHEIRTPMNGILGFANLLRKKGISDEMREKYVHLINSNGEMLVKIIDDIIDLAKIESGQLKLIDHECNINILLDEIKMFCEKQIRKSGKINVLFDLINTENEDVTINTDTLRLKQVLLNLVENAIKFTNDGTVELGYIIKGEEINFYVKDTGIGIPYEKQNVIFDRFLQLDDSPAREYGGTGLGLTISKNLVEMMGGKIWVESKPDIGSVFKFTHPLKEVAKIDETQPIEDEIMPIDYDWSDRTILIAEDEEDNYFLLEEFLKETNVKLLWAKDGLETVEMFKNNKVNLVLLDIKIPKLSGYEVVNKMKKMNPKTPVIAQTAYALTGDKERILEAGCDDYLAKPIEIEGIFNMINKYFQGEE